MDENYNKDKQELLDRFAAALSLPAADRPWFDEDDLIDVFDFAGDDGNDYLRAEALIWGARIYPDSEALLTRRAVFYSDVLTGREVKALRKDHPGSQTMLTDLLQLRADALSREDTLYFLNDIVSRYASFDDEEAIQLVDLAADSGNLDWIIENLDRLAEKAEYKAGFFYETAAEAYEAGNFEDSLVITERLVEDSPYSADFWVLRAQNQLALVDYKEVLASADMALAIDPDNIEALRIKMQALADDMSDEATRLQKQIYDSHKDDNTIAQCYIYGRLHRLPRGEADEETKDLIYEAAIRFDNDTQLFLYALRYIPERASHIIKQRLDTSLKSDSGDIHQWLQIVRSLFDALRSRKGAIMLLRKIQEYDLMAEERVYCLHLEAELCFMNEDWNDAVRAISAFISLTGNTTHILDAMLMRSYIALGLRSEAENVAAAVISRQRPSIYMDASWQIANKLQETGLRQLARNVLAGADLANF